MAKPLYEYDYEEEDLGLDDELDKEDEDEAIAASLPTKKERRDNTISDKSLGVMIVGTIMIQAAMLIVTILTNIIFISIRPRGNYAQLINGKVVEIGQRESEYRSPQAIRTFTFQTLSMLFSWNGLKPATGGDVNQTVELDGGVRVEQGFVPTTAFHGSFAIREGLRRSLLNEIAGIVPSGLLLGSREGESSKSERNPSLAEQGEQRKPKVQTVLIVDFISNPKPLRPGRWEVDVISTLIVLREGGAGEELTKFNKRLIIDAVDPQIGTLGKELQLFEPLVSIRAAGLQIVEMKNLEL